MIGALLVLGAIALMAFVFGRGGGGGFSPPDADGLEQVVEVDQVASSSKMDVVSGLQRPSDERHPDPLVDLREIRSGGPPPDGIPPIDRPFFETASSIDWLDDSEAVVVLEMGAETRAYPVQVLTWHEIVNDTVDGEPVTVSYCPLCNSAVAYERTLDDGTILDFGTSGSLYNSSLIMYDRQTESLWTHFDGLAVVGHLTGTQLTLLPMVTVAWSDFVNMHFWRFRFHFPPLGHYFVRFYSSLMHLHFSLFHHAFIPQSFSRGHLSVRLHMQDLKLHA